MTRFRLLGALSLVAWVAVAAWSQDDFDVFGTVEGATANVGGAYQNQAAPPPPVPSGVPSSSDFLNSGPAPDVAPAFLPGAPAPAVPPGVQAPALPAQNRITVIRGVSILDAVTRRQLDVPEMGQDLDANRTSYSNDGQTLGDVLANDEIWSRIETIDSQFIGPDTYTFILYYINMLGLLHEMDPLVFASVYVATPDPVSPVAQLDHYEEHQDTKIAEWNEQFLRDFRQADPLTGDVSPRGEFYAVYVPPPPFYRPVRPDPLTATPPPDFLREAWIAYMGGMADPNRIQSVRGTANPQGQYGAPGVGGANVGGEELIGGSSAQEWQGQSSYFGTTNNQSVQQNYNPELL